MLLCFHLKLAFYNIKINRKIQAIHLNFKILFVITLNINLKNSMISERPQRKENVYIQAHLRHVFSCFGNRVPAFSLLHWALPMMWPGLLLPGRVKETFSTLEVLKRSVRAGNLVTFMYLGQTN